MILKDFAEQRNINPDTIRKYIKRHEKEFRGLIKNSGNRMQLEPEAVTLLEKVYHLPQPVQVIEDFETVRELSECRKELAEVYKKLSESTAKLAQAEALKFLLEDRENQLEEEKARNRELQEMLDLERSKTWWQKLRGK